MWTIQSKRPSPGEDIHAAIRTRRRHVRLESLGFEHCCRQVAKSVTRKTLSDVILDSSYADTLQVDFRLGIVGHLAVHSAVATASLPVLAKL